VVDRNPSMARMIERSLTGSFEVEAAKPDEALAVASSLHFDVLLCEWNLGPISAKPILEAARSRHHRPRIWITFEHRLDAEATSYAAKRGLRLLSKPFRSLDLADR
jgi:DNA-binding response OmpR family regulator